MRRLLIYVLKFHHGSFFILKIVEYYLSKSRVRILFQCLVSSGHNQNSFLSFSISSQGKSSAVPSFSSR